MTAIVQTGDVFETHAELDRRRRFDEPTECVGRMVVVALDDTLWEIECDVCRWQAAVPAREADPSLVPRLQAERAARRRDASGIPSALEGLTWEHVADNHPEVLAVARRVAGVGEPSRAPVRLTGPYAPDWQGLVAEPDRVTQSPGLLLTGTVGVGKTRLAAATANAMLDHRALRWIFVPSLLTQLGRDFKDPVRTEALDLIAGTEALVLDDLDKARDTENAALPLFDAIDRRVTAGAPLIVTANLGLDQIAMKFPHGDGIASRLAQHCEAFTLNGADRRLERFAA